MPAHGRDIVGWARPSIRDPRDVVLDLTNSGCSLDLAYFQLPRNDVVVNLDSTFSGLRIRQCSGEVVPGCVPDSAYGSA